LADIGKQHCCDNKNLMAIARLQGGMVKTQPPGGCRMAAATGIAAACKHLLLCELFDVFFLNNDWSFIWQILTI
jgi:hypothetical protein